MKVNNLLKKVGSVITTAALLATLGTTAFADGGVTVGVGGEGISITKVETVQRENSTDVYDVTVTYKTTKKNVTGMTMLAYRANTNNNTPGDMELNSDAQKNAYDDSKYGEGENSPKKMQIVGIEQNAAVDGTSGDGTGSFTFTVTTNSTNNGAYYIAKGKKALVAVSGDQCKPAYALFGVNATAQSAGPVELKNVEVPANADVKTKLIEAAKGISVNLYEGETMLTNGVSLQNLQNEDFSGFSKTGNEYTFKAKLTKSNITVPEGIDFPDDGIEVMFTATITKTAVDATAVDTFNGKSVENGKFIIEVQKSDLDSQTGDKGDYLRNQILNKKVKFKAEETGMTTLYGEILVDNSMVSAKKEYAEGTNTYDYTVTVPEGQITDSYVIVPEALKTFNVSVSVTEKPAITAITPTSEINDSDYSFAVSDTDTFTAENIAAKLKNDRAGDSTAVKYTVGTEQKDATLEDFVYGWDVTITGDTAEAKLKITGIKTESISNQYSLNLTDNVLATVTVTKEEGTPIKLGDVNFDNKITGADLNMMKAFLAGQLPKDGQVSKDLYDASSVRYNAANINRDTKFNGADLNRYKAHLAGQLTDENIGQIIVGHISTK